MEILDDKFIEEIEGFMTNAEQSVGLPSQKQIEGPSCLSYSLDQIKKMTLTELGECSYELSQYNFHLNRNINRRKAWLRWCKNKLEEAASIELPSIDQRFGYNERVMIAKNTPHICKKINKFMRSVQLELDMMESIPQCIKFISDAIRDVKLSRISEEKHGS